MSFTSSSAMLILHNYVSKLYLKSRRTCEVSLGMDRNCFCKTKRSFLLFLLFSRISCPIIDILPKNVATRHVLLRYYGTSSTIKLSTYINKNKAQQAFHNSSTARAMQKKKLIIYSILNLDVLDSLQCENI